MAHALSLYEMTSGAPLDGTVLAHEALHDTEVTRCIKDATTMDDLCNGTIQIIRAQV
jgi:hypothetical protein